MYSTLLANPRRMFLVDGLGALTSTLLLPVLAHWESFFGMPGAVLYRLMPIAAALTLYSLTCYALRPRRLKLYLYFIAAANLLYCGGTLGLLVFYFEKLTTWGVAYFLGEKIIVVTLAVVEIRLARAEA
jgi:hypothetical protein